MVKGLERTSVSGHALLMLHTSQTLPCAAFSLERPNRTASREHAM